MGEMLRWLGRNAEEVICAAMMTFMTILGFANVVARYLGYSMAYTEEAKGKLDEAVQTLTEITTTQKDDPLIGEALVSLGRLYEAQKKTDEAIKTYGQVAERYPNTSWAMQAQQRLSAKRSK